MSTATACSCFWSAGEGRTITDNCQAVTCRTRIVCAACSGSGYYDITGSPPCGACGGTGTAAAQHVRLDGSGQR